MDKSGFDRRNECFSYSFFILLVSCASIFFSSCNSASPTLEAKNEFPTNINVKQSNLQNFDHTQSINFKGVSFQNKIPLVSEITASEEPAVPLEDENDKADYVQSRRILFKLNGEYASKHKESFYQPKIIVYPIAEYRQASAKSKTLVESIDKSTKKLQEIITARTAKREDISRITSIDASPEILAQFKQISFNNGKGVLYVTQYNVDWATIINNQQLSYIFQGISEDGKYYVQAAFPITLKELPDSLYDNKFRDYEMPQVYFTEKRRPELYAAYRKYLASVETLLDNSKTNEFNPDLSKIEETLSSLEINWKD